MARIGIALCRVGAVLAIWPIVGYLAMLAYAGYLFVADPAALHTPVPRWVEVGMGLGIISLVAAVAILIVVATGYLLTRRENVR